LGQIYREQKREYHQCAVLFHCSGHPGPTSENRQGPRSVVLMIAVEAQFGIEFPDAMLSRDVFRSIETIAGAIETIQREES
jgi:hypothetical protein